MSLCAAAVIEHPTSCICTVIEYVLPHEHAKSSSYHTLILSIVMITTVFCITTLVPSQSSAFSFPKPCKSSWKNGR